MLSYKKSRQYIPSSPISLQPDIYPTHPNSSINLPPNNMDLNELTSRPNYGQIFYSQQNNQYSQQSHQPSKQQNDQLRRSLKQQEQRHAHLLRKLDYLEMENRKLKGNEGQIQYGNSGNDWEQVWKRLRYLKDQNQWLRNNLLTILKKKSF